MLGVLKNRTYRHLFGAQMIALLGTGLATVALGLLAYDIAGDQASIVLGLALTIKMISYVTLAPIAAALAERLPRRAWLVGLDLIRAGVAFCLPFVTEIWQIYVLVFLLQSASAGFTPAFQATIPDILTEEEDYTNALSLSRLAYDLESLITPMLAAALLTMVTFNTLFFGTFLGFFASALLVVSVILPNPKPTKPRGFWDRTTRGLKLFLAVPTLRGLMALNLLVASTSAMVFVNSVVIVRGILDLGERGLPLVLAAFGTGSMLTALLLPRILKHLPDRPVMLCGAAVSALSLLSLTIFSQLGLLSLGTLMLSWFGIGLGYSGVLTPTGRLLRSAAAPEDRPALFAAQFTLSHACWLVTYPLSGWLLASHGLDAAGIGLFVLGCVGFGAALYLWRAKAPDGPVNQT
jgi:MFS family permease